MSDTLARQVVEFSAVGLDALKAGMEAARGTFEHMAQAATKVQAGVQSAMQNSAARVQAAGETIGNAMKAAGERVNTAGDRIKGLAAQVSALGDRAATLRPLQAAFEAVNARVGGMLTGLRPAAAAIDALVSKAAGKSLNLLGGGVQLGGSAAAAIAGAGGAAAGIGQSIASAMAKAGPMVSQAIGGMLASLPRVGELGSAAFGKLAAATRQAGQVMDGMGKSIDKARDSIAASPLAIGAAVAGFEMLTNAARSWVNMGLQGTNYGNALHAQMQLLSQQIAGVFVPVIQAVTDGVRRLSQWFRSLTGDQQAIIRHFVEAAAVMVIAHKAVGRITEALGGFVKAGLAALTAVAGGIVSTLIPAFVTLVSAVVSGSGVMSAAIGFATAGIATIVGALAAAASVAVSFGIAAGGAGAVLGTGLAVGTEQGRSALGRLVESLKPLGQAMRETFTALRRAIEPVLDALGGTAGRIFERIGAAVTSFVRAALPTLQRFGQMAAEFLERAFTGLEAVASFVLPIVEQVGRGLLQMAEAAMPAVRAFGSLFLTVLEQVGRTAAAVFSFFAPLLQGVAEAGMRVFAAFGRLYNAAARIWDAVVRLAGAFARFTGEASPIGTLLQAAFALGVQAIEGFADRMELVVTIVESAVVPVMNGLVQALASVVDGIARLTEAWALSPLGRATGGERLAERMRALAAEIRGIRIDLSPATASRERRAAEGPAARTDVAPAGGQFEQAEALFRRINEAAIKTSAEDRAAQQRENTNAILRKIEEALKRKERGASGPISPRAGTVGAGHGVPAGLVGGAAYSGGGDW